MMRIAGSLMWVGLMLALGASKGNAAEAPATQPSEVPVEAFFDTVDMERPELSPDGMRMAAVTKAKSGRLQLSVFETANLPAGRVIATFDNADITGVAWVSNDRLVFTTHDLLSDTWDSRSVARFAIDRDGTKGTALNGRAVASSFSPAHDPLDSIVRYLNDGSSDVIEGVWKLKWGQWTDQVAVRYDTRSGHWKPITEASVPLGLYKWIVDDKGAPRAAMGYDKSDTFVVTVAPDGTFVERGRWPSLGSGGDALQLLAWGPDGQVYAVRSNGDRHGSRGLYRFDLATGKTDPEPLLSTHGFDIDPALVIDERAHKVLGVRYTTDAAATAWFDSDLKALQARIDAALPGTVNRIDLGACGCAARAVVTSSSDRQPARYYLFDRGSNSLAPLGGSRPAIAPKLMAQTDFFRVKSRDGQEIPVWVTRPAGKGPFPTVVLVHDGPWIRGWSWEWDAESQFLASRGYLVVKPEFRGSHGYGRRWFEAGARQWGLKMQDDIADATTWATSQGSGGPARTCIVGQGYGGYAALMGLVRYAELYRCGVSLSAPTDLKLILEPSGTDAGPEDLLYGMKPLIGDPETDGAQLDATSPLKLAAQIRRPVLLAHGGIDRHVDVAHGVKLRRALEAAKVPVTWLEYKDEGHFLNLPQDRADFHRRMEQFLAVNIGSPSVSP